MGMDRGLRLLEDLGRGDMLHVAYEPIQSE
jgi:hypothetical protein